MKLKSKLDTGKILILNGSPSGKKGNCAQLIKCISQELKSMANFEVIHLSDNGYSKKLRQEIEKCQALIFVTGTYWDSWGSPLQKLLEEMTELEATPALVGKPVSVFVLMHSVGGKAVLSRLQGVLSTMGCLIPPMSGMVYSLVSHVALKSNDRSHAKDFWQLGDIKMILENLMIAVKNPISWVSWPVDDGDAGRRWLR